jgi:hypothetical protein
MNTPLRLKILVAQAGDSFTADAGEIRNVHADIAEPLLAKGHAELAPSPSGSGAPRAPAEATKKTSKSPRPTRR